MNNNKFTIGDVVYYDDVMCKVVDILGFKTNNFRYDLYEVNGDGFYMDIPESKLMLAY
jgi:hypothetical protein